ncbi:sterol desaturase family protein [Nocardia asteroides]|nr:sterol desaturase family protein [Nocardia asteroides]
MYWSVVDALWSAVIQPFRLLLSANVDVGILFYPFLLVAMIWTFRRQPREESLTSYVTFRRALLSRSGRLDIRFYFTNIILMTLLYTYSDPWYRQVPHVVESGWAWLLQEPRLYLLNGGFLASTVVTVLVFMAADLSFFLFHMLMHRVSWLWEFHKIHHSATELNPLTSFRAHPVQLYLTTTAGVVFSGVVLGSAGYFSSGTVQVLSWLGSNVLFIGSGAFLLAALRHSHVWIHFGPRLNRILYSPAHHQIHHSGDSADYNANYGGLLALWDWMAGTLIIPGHERPIYYGLGSTAQNNQYTSIAMLYTRPFVNLWHRASRRDFNKSESGNSGQLSGEQPR